MIGISLLLEEIRILNNCLLDAQKVKQSVRVIVFRIIVLVLILIPAFLGIDEYYLIIVMGGLLAPCLSVLFPVTCLLI